MTALKAGAASAAQDEAPDAVKDSYRRLLNAIRKQLSGYPDGEQALEADLQAAQESLMVQLTRAGAENDADLVAASLAVMELVDAAGVRAGKYAVTISGSYGAQTGDHNTQFNSYHFHASRNFWSARNIALFATGIVAIGVILATVIPGIFKSSPRIPSVSGNPSRSSGTIQGAMGLELDSVTAESEGQQYGGEPGCNTLDFKVQNLGASLIVISYVRIKIEKIEPISVPPSTGVLPSSATYPFILPFRVGTYDVPVSEEVASNQADRFELRLQLGSAAEAAAPSDDGFYQYDIQLSLLYGHDDSLNAGSETLFLSPTSPIR